MELHGNREDIARLPFVLQMPTDGRAVILLPYFDGKGWWLALPMGAGSVELGKVSDLITGSYLAKGAADASSEYEFHLETLVVENLSFPGFEMAIAKLESDVHRSSAVLEKDHLVSSMRNDPHVKASLLAASELEYLLLLLRSPYDLLQGLVVRVASLTPREQGLKHLVQGQQVSLTLP